MKKTLSALAVAAMTFGIMSCNNQPKANDTKETAKPATATAVAGSQQIAYVEIDSIMTQYTYWKEVAKILEAKEKNIQKTLAGKQQALQQAAANFQHETFRPTSTHRHRHSKFRQVFRSKLPMPKPCNSVWAQSIRRKLPTTTRLFLTVYTTT